MICYMYLAYFPVLAIGFLNILACWSGLAVFTSKYNGLLIWFSSFYCLLLHSLACFITALFTLYVVTTYYDLALTYYDIFCSICLIVKFWPLQLPLSTFPCGHVAFHYSGNFFLQVLHTRMPPPAMSVPGLRLGPLSGCLPLYHRGSTWRCWRWLLC